MRTSNASQPDGSAARAPGSLDEVLHQSDRSRVWRVHLADGLGCFICKVPQGPLALERLRHEEKILARLSGVEGVSRLARVAHPAHLLMLEDSDGVPLVHMLQGAALAVPELLRLALSLAHTIAAVHRAGVVHKDINPANILLCGPQRTPELIDFHLASTFTQDQPGFTHHREIAGTLAYLAPEQSGRTGHSVDHRADLYALGATFYEMATGRPPFAQDDALQLIHDHLAHLPTPPAALNPRLPQALSEVILRLLEKEPERRYQSAEGLAHDLTQIIGSLARDDTTPFVLGERDFALRLAPPSRLIGRDGDIAALQTALEDTLHSQRRGVLIAGAPGVGKTALINTLRPMVTAQRGWFVCGKFDQYRQDIASDAVRQALRALGRLLLAEPEAELAPQRERILAALGPNAGLITLMLPEFALLLGPQHTINLNDSTEAEGRLLQAGLALLGAIVSPKRPVVMVLDDLQWAASTPIRFIDAMLTDEGLRGLLVVGAYRTAEVDAAHPLSALLPRWNRLAAAPLRLQLQNLPPTDLSVLLAEMLRLAPKPAAHLARVINANTQGNPFDTVELVNALRRDGALIPGDAGWHWDAAAIRRFIGHGNVVDLLSARIARLPPQSQQLLAIMACLGGDLDLGLLQAASGLSADTLDEQLTAPLEDGLLVLESGETRTVRFRHDRVQQAAYSGRRLAERQALHLDLARRLAARPGLDAKAAEQYLPAVEALQNPHECRHAIGLFRGAAAHLHLINYAAAERFLAAALALLESIAAKVESDKALHTALEIERHAALCRLGRLEEADAVYHSIEGRGSDPLALVDATCVQLNSLTNRRQLREALSLGFALLQQLGMVVSQEDVQVTIASRLAAFHRWVNEDSAADGLNREETKDPCVRGSAKLMNAMTPAAFFSDQTILTWLVLETQRLWVDRGFCAAMVSTLSHTGLITIATWEDYRSGYDVVQHVLKVSEMHGYALEAARARFLFSLISQHWFEPLEDSVDQAQRARKGLLQGGNLLDACFTYTPILFANLDCAPSLDATLTEVDAALAFAARTGNRQAAPAFTVFRQFLRALRGETSAPGSFSDVSFEEATYVADMHANQSATRYFHIMQALTGALFSEQDRLAHHCAMALPLMAMTPGYYSAALVHFLHALALAERIKTAAPHEQAALLSELDARRDWLTLRAADCPVNFLHLQRLVQAERAAAVGDWWEASSHFDTALNEVARGQRPWHRALITERAALFKLAHGLEHHGRQLLAEARQHYAAWGASAKVREMERRHPFLRGVHQVRRDGGSFGGTVGGTLGTTIGGTIRTIGGSVRTDSLSISVDAIDILAILRASQALSSETSLERLRVRVVELLGEITGATQVLLVLWRDDPPGWHLSVEDGAAPVSIEDGGDGKLLPLSAFRYAERTREPLLLEDATHDDRFAHDPYIATLKRCSLLVVPILSQGVPRAMLLLENRLSRGAFSADRLDAVMLMTGQLAVSLDNALLYASLEHKVAQRTEALAQANQQLALLSITDPLTGLANRRRFNDVQQAEWLRAVRTQASIGVAMIDIDQFKLYNDHYGHHGGDECLKRVAGALGEGLRQGIDLVARYGGEEFAFILPGADYETTLRVAERARAGVAALKAPHTSAVHGIVTVSIGVTALLASENGTPEQLFAIADAALYEAKRKGRNRVEGRR